MAHWWNDTDRGETELFEEKSVRVPHCPPKIPYILEWNRNWSFVVRDLSKATKNASSFTPRNC